MLFECLGEKLVGREILLVSMKKNHGLPGIEIAGFDELDQIILPISQIRLGSLYFVRRSKAFIEAAIAMIVIVIAIAVAANPVGNVFFLIGFIFFDRIR